MFKQKQQRYKLRVILFLASKLRFIENGHNVFSGRLYRLVTDKYSKAQKRQGTFSCQNFEI